MSLTALRLLRVTRPPVARVVSRLDSGEVIVFWPTAAGTGIRRYWRGVCLGGTRGPRQGQYLVKRVAAVAF
jgi:hypothetical protein